MIIEDEDIDLFREAFLEMSKNVKFQEIKFSDDDGEMMPNWHEEREAWNKEDKCARAACKASLVRRGKRCCGKHTGTGLEYCVSCTRLINEANPMPDGLPLVVWSVVEILNC